VSGLVYTDSVFNVIGDYPVVDQFDVSYINLLTGSMTDQYVTGSLFIKYSKGSKINPFGGPSPLEWTDYGERGLAFSKCNPNNHKNFPGGDTSYGLQSWGERSGISRCVRIFSSRDRYYDSMTPAYDKMMNVLGGAPDVGPGGVIRISIGMSGSATFTTALSFHESFPFESKFKQILRSKLISSDYKGQEIVVQEEGDTGPASPPYASAWYNSFGPPSTYILSNDLSKVMFGFGDRRKSFETDPGTIVGQSNLPEYRQWNYTGFFNILTGPIIRGWKYGLISALPHYTSAVFRRDRYGQFRDMLEQRPVAVTVFDPNNSPMKYFGDVETPPFTSTPGVSEPLQSDVSTKFTVKVAFGRITLMSKYGPPPAGGDNLVSGTTGDVLEYVNLSPLETDSSNLSTFVTSSLPYFD